MAEPIDTLEADWTPPNQWETATDAIGGKGGAMNDPLVALVKRDNFLKEEGDALRAVGGSALIGFALGSESAVERKVQDKLRERVSVKDFGAKLDGAADDTAAFVAALAFGAANGVEVIVPGGIAKITAPLTVSCHVRHTGNVSYKFTLSSNQDGLTFVFSNSVVGRMGFVGHVDIDMQATGRDAMHLQKFEGLELGNVTIYNAVRAGVNVEPVNDYDWMENLNCNYLKVSNCQTWLRVRIPNKIGAFANLFRFGHFEGRVATGVPVDVIFDATTTIGQSCAEWFFGVCETDTGQTNAGPNSNCIFSAQRINGATAGLAQTWTFGVLVMENTKATDAKVHAYGFYCNGSVNLWNNLSASVDRFNVTDGLHPTISAAMGRVNYCESGRINTAAAGNYSRVMRGGTLTDRVVVDHSLSVAAGATADIAAPATLTNVQRMVTQYGGGDSFYAAGSSKNVYQVGVDVGATASYEVHRIRLIEQTAAADGYTEFLVICNAGAVQVLRTVGTKFTAAVGAGYVQITNSDSAAHTVRHVRTREI